MVIFKSKQRIKQLELENKALKEQVSNLDIIAKGLVNQMSDMTKKVDSVVETVQNLVDDGKNTVSAQQLLREYLYGEDDS